MSYTLEVMKQSVGRILKSCLDSDFRHRKREMARLHSLPRYEATTTDLLGTRLQIVDAYSFLGMYQEIFEQEVYRFASKNNSPYIVDGGANIGLGVLYFKRLFPTSEIVAFEPDETVFCALEFNVQKLKNVTLVRRALWSSETTLDFFAEGSWGGRLAQSGDEVRYPVKTVRLADYLTRPVDFLKLDIEGAETEVLQDCADLLCNVERVFVEYHSFLNQPQLLESLLHILGGAGFRVDIHPCAFSRSPFLVRRNHLGIDLLLNIFAYRS